MSSKPITLAGGLDEVERGIDAIPGTLIRANNIECKRKHGYRSIKGYSKFDSTEVPGEGGILGVWRFNNKVYAFRNAAGGATAVMHESTGSGWTSKKTGLTPSGTYRFDNANLSGTQAMYLASGVHKAAEWDGSTWTDVTTGMATDTPTHVIGHRGHLFLSFGPSVQASPVGDPAGTWALVLGATEILTNSDVTGFMQTTGGHLLIGSRNHTYILQGFDDADWVLESMEEYGNQMGVIEGTLQQLGSRIFYLDDRGVTELSTSQNFGDFSDATLTEMVEETIAAKKNIVAGSCVVKDKTQYRLFFTDGTGLIATFHKNTLKGWTPFSLPITVTAICNAEDANGDEVIYAGADDGFIYQLESTDQFDGAAIPSYFVTTPTHLGSPYLNKRFRRTQADLQAGGPIVIQGKNIYPLKDDITSAYKNLTVDGLPGALLGQVKLGSGLLGESDLTSGSMDTPGNGEYVSTYVSSNSVQVQWEMDNLNYQFFEGKQKRR